MLSIGREAGLFWIALLTSVLKFQPADGEQGAGRAMAERKMLR